MDKITYLSTGFLITVGVFFRKLWEGGLIIESLPAIYLIFFILGVIPVALGMKDKASQHVRESGKALILLSVGLGLAAGTRYVFGLSLGSHSLLTHFLALIGTLMLVVIIFFLSRIPTREYKR